MKGTKFCDVFDGALPERNHLAWFNLQTTHVDQFFHSCDVSANANVLSTADRRADKTKGKLQF